MPKSRPYIVNLSLPDPADDKLTITEQRLVNSTSQSAAERHAIKRHIPGVLSCRIATNTEVMRLLAGGMKLEDTTGDPALAEKALDVSGLIGGEG
jgi:hypothetical protein